MFLLLGVPSLILFLNGLNGITDGLIRVPVPGRTPVQLEKGTWTVFYEYTGRYPGVSELRSRQAPGIEGRLRTEEGREFPIVGSTTSFNYNFAGRGGYSIGTVDVDRSGRYLFEARLTDANDSERYVLALGRNVGRSTAFLVFGIFGMMGGGAIAFIVWLVVFILRYRSKNRAASASPA